MIVPGSGTGADAEVFNWMLEKVPTESIHISLASKPNARSMVEFLYEVKSTVPVPDRMRLPICEKL